MKYTIVVVRYFRYYHIDLYEVLYIDPDKGIQLTNVSDNKHLLHKVQCSKFRCHTNGTSTVRYLIRCYYLDLLSINLVMLPSGNPAMIVKYTSTICLENVTILYVQTFPPIFLFLIAIKTKAHPCVTY